MSFLNGIQNPSDIKKLPKHDLPQLAKEVREYILEIVSTNGGHLGAALGAVDLTIALHYCFTTPDDTIVWDVGHQVHAHKILTGRKEAFRTFRQEGGTSGFSNKDESEHDPFTTGHGGASISTAFGIAVGNRVLKKNNKAIAVIGDASLGSGMAFEAINHAGHVKDNLIVILNDNEMSISPTVGALSKSFNKFISSGFYNHLRHDIAAGLKRIPGVGDLAVAKAKKLDEGIKHMFVPGLLFEEMGFRYFGPLDGHNIEAMIEILENVKKIEGPVFLHVITKKGKGYQIAEADPSKWHASTPFCVETGELKPIAKQKSYTKVFGDTMIRLAEKNPKVIAITAAMCDGTGLIEYSKKFPDRFFDVGIAEEHGVSFAAGLCEAGLRPFVAIYSTFLQRAHDQIIHDVALQSLPVVFCLDRGGLVGEDGPTHHGVFDISYLRKVPGMTLMSPRDSREFEAMLELAAGHLTGPIAVRYPRGAVAEETSSPLKDIAPAPVVVGKSEILKEGKDVLILAYGSLVYTAYEAAAMLAEKGIEATVVNARFAKPLDETAILRLAQEKRLVVTLEEGSLIGGFGESILELFEKQEGTAPRIRTLGIPDRFIEHGKRESLLDKLGLSAPKIAAEIVKILKPEENYSLKANGTNGIIFESGPRR